MAASCENSRPRPAPSLPVVRNSWYGAKLEANPSVSTAGTSCPPTSLGLRPATIPGRRPTPPLVAPLIFRRKEYRPGSGGAGRWRGGDGQVIEIAHAQGAPFAIFALFDRIENPARGRAVGSARAAGEIRLPSGARLNGMGKQIIPAGDAVVLELPGGGGLGEVS